MRLANQIEQVVAHVERLFSSKASTCNHFLQSILFVEMPTFVIIDFEFFDTAPDRIGGSTGEYAEANSRLPRQRDAKAILYMKLLDIRITASENNSAIGEYAIDIEYYEFDVP